MCFCAFVCCPAGEALRDGRAVIFGLKSEAVPSDGGPRAVTLCAWADPLICDRVLAIDNTVNLVNDQHRSRAGSPLKAKPGPASNLSNPRNVF